MELIGAGKRQPFKNAFNIGMNVRPETQLRALERRTKKVEEELQHLKYSSNVLSPPNALPVEVLSHILTLHSTLVMKDHPPWKKKSLERVRVAHVCRHWREVALKTTALWSNLIFVTPAWAEVSFGRSKTAPVSIDFDVGDTRYKDTLSRILSQPHRLRSVKIASIPSLDILSQLTLATPILEKIVLKFGDHRWGTNLPIPELPDKFLDRNAPLLRHLELVDMGIPSYNMLPLVPSLTYLQLGSTAQMTTRPSADALLDSLRRLPQLETLILTNYVPAGASASSSLHPVHCPALLTVNLMDSTLAIESLFHAMRIPQATLSLTLTTIVEKGETLDTFLAALSAARGINAGSPLPLKDLAVKMRSPIGADYLEFDLGFGGRPTGLPGGGPPKISIAVKEPLHMFPMDFLTAFSEGGLIHMDTLQSLHMENSRWTFEPSHWDFLAGLPYIRNISFTCGADDLTFCQALKSGRTPTSDNPTFPPFHSLSQLSFQSYGLVPGGGIRDVIIEALKSRPQAHPVGSLRITWSEEDVTKEGCQFLRDSVPGLEIIWEEGDQENSYTGDSEESDEWSAQGDSDDE